MSPPGVGVADTLLADRYHLVERIAVGGMGEVWRAEDVLLDRTVAVKKLRPEHVDDEDFRARFRAEARHAGRLSHPGIASIYDFGERDGQAWLVMELVEGEPLSALLRRQRTLSVDRTLDVVAQTAAALQAAHDGRVVHRDVKPGNLLVRPDGAVKVTDFGIASAADAVPLTRTGTVVGTAFYLSPEQAAGSSGIPASDVYSLGVVAYECLAGGRPFPGDNPVAVALAHLQSPPPDLPSTVPAPVRELVAQALAKDPADRFVTAGEMCRRATELRAALAPTGADPDPARGGGGLAALPVEPPAATGILPLPAAPPLEPLRRPALRVPGSRARSSRSAVRVAALLLALLALGAGVRTAASSTSPTVAASVTVPAVAIGTPEDTARRLLEDTGLPVERRDGSSTTVPPGSVLSVSPEAGSTVAPGTPVVLVVSTGPPRVAVEAAGYLGRPAAEVQAALSDLGLLPRLVDDGSGRPVGTVSSVEPAGQVVVGTTVTVHVVPVPAPVVQQPAPAEPPAPGKQPGRGKGKSQGKGKG
ncbi:MAG: protein kinase [Mycobacteriales bacterium]